MLEMELKGFEDIELALKSLPLKLKTSIVRGAIKKSATVVLKEIRKNAPQDSGAMATRFKLKKLKAKKDNKIFYTIVNLDYGHIATFLEYGTYAKRDIPLNKKTKYSGKRAVRRNKIIAKGLGIDPKPFMRPALDAKSGEAFQESKKYVVKRLKKALK